jgi:hypothetical protein
MLAMGARATITRTPNGMKFDVDDPQGVGWVAVDVAVLAEFVDGWNRLAELADGWNRESAERGIA